MTFSEAFTHRQATQARAIDMMEAAGIPPRVARELLRDLSEAEIALRQSFTADSQRAYRAGLDPKSPQEN